MQAADSLNQFEAEVPEALQPRFREIAAIIDRFCEERLDAEFREVCRRMLACFCQPETNIHRGKAASWAAGIVYQAGQINNLTNSRSRPHCKSDEIAKGCGVSVATMHTKGHEIRDGLQLVRFDPAFTVRSRLADNPLAWIMELPEGAVVDLKDVPDQLRRNLNEIDRLPPRAQWPTLSDWRTRKARAQQSSEPGLVFTLKITLLGIKPLIWRRVELTDCTLEELHYVIQYAMGWEDAHLHEFLIDGRRFQPVSWFGVEMSWNEFCDDYESTEDTRMSDVIPVSGKMPFPFTYTYDFGDDWEHQVVVESIESRDAVAEAPVCLAGERACPPEDCGGVWGYQRLLELRRDPNNPESKELSEWLDSIDPEQFDPDEVNTIFRTWCRRR